MFYFTYREEKAVLLTSDDLKTVLQTSRITSQLVNAIRFWKMQLSEWRNLKVKYLFLITSKPLDAFPKYMRSTFSKKHRKHCHIGEL